MKTSRQTQKANISGEQPASFVVLSTFFFFALKKRIGCSLEIFDFCVFFSIFISPLKTPFLTVFFLYVTECVDLNFLAHILPHNFNVFKTFPKFLWIVKTDCMYFTKCRNGLLPLPKKIPLY